MQEEIRDVAVGGQRLRVAHRPGRGRPLVVCNGIGANLDLLTSFVEALDADIAVIRFDVPGVGNSPLPERPYVFATLARLVRKLVEKLGYREFDVLGISWGGALAQQLAFQNPRRCRRLVVVSTATGWMMVPAHPRVLSKMVTPRRYRDPEYAVQIAADIYGGRLREQPAVVSSLLNSSHPQGSRRGYYLQLAAGVGWTSLPFLPLIRQPTLVLAGMDDPIIPVVNARIMAALMPNARLLAYDDGHLGLVTRAHDLAPEVSSFLRRT